jgi:multidrug efflux pump subunit AcrA (membrane-fusion protein)
MQVEVDVPNPNLVLNPGMYAETVIRLQHNNNALAIPSQAVMDGDQQPSVLVVNSANKVEKRDVKLGIEGANRTEIVSGLSPGECVIVSNQVNYQPGETVRPRQQGATP